MKTRMTIAFVCLVAGTAMCLWSLTPDYRTRVPLWWIPFAVNFFSIVWNGGILFVLSNRVAP